MSSGLASIEASLAWMAEHGTVTPAFRRGLDIYKVTASEMLGTAYSQVDSDQRFGRSPPCPWATREG